MEENVMPDTGTDTFDTVVASVEQRQGFDIPSLAEGGAQLDGEWYASHVRMSQSKKNLVVTLRQGGNPGNPNRLDCFIDRKHGIDEDINTETGEIEEIVAPEKLFKKGYTFHGVTVCRANFRDGDDEPFTPSEPSLVVDHNNGGKELVFWSCYLLKYDSVDPTGSPMSSAAEQLIADLARR
jgi:hypothetical protein